MHPLPDVILASGSAARAAMLRGVGVSFRVVPSKIDERALEASFATLSLDPSPLRERERSVATGRGNELSTKLAQAKALDISRIHPDSLVIGADQILELNGEILHKANTLEDAKSKLRKLSGKTHSLISSVCVAKGGEVLWSGSDTAHLTMHILEDDFLQTYCDQAGDVLTACVGAYALEGHGAWLFEKIEGDYFTILGMPLLPLLGFLKTFKP